VLLAQRRVPRHDDGATWIVSEILIVFFLPMTVKGLLGA
jgi:hypothetical protein